MGNIDLHIHGVQPVGNAAYERILSETDGLLARARVRGFGPLQAATLPVRAARRPLVLKETQVTELPEGRVSGCESPVGERFKRPCGHCPRCIKRRKWDAESLLRLECSEADRIEFVTVTVRGRIADIAARRLRARGLPPGPDGSERLPYPADYVFAPSEIEGAVYRDVVGEALKRLRGSIGSAAYGGRSPRDDLRFYAVSEEGRKAGRLHYHVLLLFRGAAAVAARYRMIKEAFGRKVTRRGARRAVDRLDGGFRVPAGFIHIKNVCDAGKAKFFKAVSQYVQKCVGYSVKSVGAEGRVRCSNGFGRQVVEMVYRLGLDDFEGQIADAVLAGVLPRLVVRGVSVRFGALKRTGLWNAFQRMERIKLGDQWLKENLQPLEYLYAFGDSGLTIVPGLVAGSSDRGSLRRALLDRMSGRSYICGVAGSVVILERMEKEQRIASARDRASKREMCAWLERMREEWSGSGRSKYLRQTREVVGIPPDSTDDFGAPF